MRRSPASRPRPIRYPPRLRLALATDCGGSVGPVSAAELQVAAVVAEALKKVGVSLFSGCRAQGAVRPGGAVQAHFRL